MLKPTLYLAGGLFTAGEQIHNLYLEKALQAIGYTVILPQEATEGLSSTEIRRFCQRNSSLPFVLLVGNMDGPDTDSGTAVEYGIAIMANGRAVMYHTDSRIDEKDTEHGVNAMFNLGHTQFVYHRASLTDLSQIEKYYCALAKHIDTAIDVLTSPG